MQMGMQVMRFNWTQVSCGNAEYMLHLTGELLGDNQTLFDISSCWTNRTFYEVPLPCSSSYVATVRSGSDNSLPLVGKTGILRFIPVLLKIDIWQHNRTSVYL